MPFAANNSIVTNFEGAEGDFDDDGDGEEDPDDKEDEVYHTTVYLATDANIVLSLTVTLYCRS